jgi:hypothetical protein
MVHNLSTELLCCDKVRTEVEVLSKWRGHVGDGHADPTFAAAAGGVGGAAGGGPGGGGGAFAAATRSRAAAALLEACGGDVAVAAGALKAEATAAVDRVIGSSSSS